MENVLIKPENIELLPTLIRCAYLFIFFDFGHYSKIISLKSIKLDGFKNIITILTSTQDKSFYS